jgi:(4S)-4-hydroxy-5-phosphonooxypentane-2,3-dione isomerase
MNLHYPYPLHRATVSGLMISLVILVEVAAGKADKFQHFIAEEAADVIAHEPGCVQFVVSRSKEVPDLFTLAEFYVDEAALEVHRKTPHFLLFQERVDAYGLIAKKTPVLGEVVFPL